MPPKKGPTPLARWKMACIWVLHFDNPRKWLGNALRQVDWRNVHEYGIGYEPYSVNKKEEESEELRAFLKRQDAAQRQQSGLRFTPIVRTQPQGRQTAFGT